MKEKMNKQRKLRKKNKAKIVGRQETKTVDMIISRIPQQAITLIDVFQGKNKGK